MACSSDQLDLDALVGLTSPQSSVDASSRDRAVVQEELERKLKCRADRDDLVKKNILPDLTTSPKLFTQAQQLQKAKIADNLQKKLRNRADRNDLMQMNILPDIHANIDPRLQATQLQLKKNKLADSLNEKLASRPGPLELIGILQPRNQELAAAVQSVPFERTSQGLQKGLRPEVPEIAFQGSEGMPSQRHSVAGIFSGLQAAEQKDLTSPESVSGRKFSDSSLSPAHSPSESCEDARSPMKSPLNSMSPSFPSSQFPVVHPPKPTHTPGILTSSIGKAPSPSQQRKKQQKQQKYRKLRYHEYVPPSKNNGKGGKTTPKPHAKGDSPYSLLLQQQQLFLQLQVLQQQYPNGVLMQKLPDLINTLSKGEKSKGRTSPSSDGSKANSGPSVPQVLPVEQPNRFNALSARFDELKVSDLKAACKELGMIVSGKKAELVERLLEHNNGALPAIALPDNQLKERRQAYSIGHASSVDSQVSVQSTISPISPSMSPIFKFPSDQNGLQHSGLPPPHMMDTFPGLHPLGAPQVFPASDLQQQFDEMVEKQKRDYISKQKAHKSLAPRPELDSMVAIKFPCPSMDQMQRSAKVSTLPCHRSSEAKMQLPLQDKQSRSLPSSPRPLSPTDSASGLLHELELMEATSGSQMKQELPLDNSHPNSTIAAVSQPSSDSVYLAPSSMPLNMIVSSAAQYLTSANSTIYCNPAFSTPAPPSYFHKSHRPPRSSLPIPVQAKVHPMNPPSYHASTSPMMQRSISVSAAPLGHSMRPPPGIPRIHSATSFSSDVSDPGLLTSSGEMGKPMTSDNLLNTEELMDVQMETEYKDLIDILRAEGNEFGPPLPHPSHSTAMHSKLGTRQDSVQSDSIMLAGGVPFGCSHLIPPNRSGSDLCLNREGHKNSGVSNNMYTCNMLPPGELGWLDLDSSNTLSLSPTHFSSMTHSNPGSLPHEQFHLNFLDDSQMKSSNPTLNGLSSRMEMNPFLDPGIPHQSGFFHPSADETVLLELGLSS